MTLPDETYIHQHTDDEDDKMQLLTQREVLNYFNNTDDSWEKPVGKTSHHLLRVFKSILS